MTALRDNPRLDPYLKWGIDSDFRGFKRPREQAGELMLPLAIQFRSKQTPSSLPMQALALIKSYDSRSKFWTVDWPLSLLPALLLSPSIKRLKLGLPSTPSESPLKFEAWSMGNVVSITATDYAGDTRMRFEAWSMGNVVSIPIVGVIDHGIGFLNSNFRDSQGASRIVRLWDQEDPVVPDYKPADPESPWKHPSYPQFRAYGRELEMDTEEFKTWLAARDVGETEDELYAALGYAPAQKRAAHGTHVLDLAAGTVNPMEPHADADAASRAPIIAVQLPWRPFKDTSSASLCVHLIEGLRYIAEHAGALNPVVINISDGAYAGAHGGNSLLECAIDEFLVLHENVKVVIAAGNGYEERLHGRKQRKEPSPTMRWRVLPDTKTDSFLEIWCPDAKGVTVTLTDPFGTATVIALGANQVLTGSGGATVIGGVYSTRDLDLNGYPSGMFLIALAPTKPKAASHPAAPHGIWTVVVDGVDKFDAYIQRSNPALGDKGPRRQSYFVDDREAPQYVSGERTLNNIATGENPMVVAGHYLRGRWFDPTTLPRSREARYASRGPGRKGDVSGPNATAPSEDSPQLHGLLASGVKSGTRVRMGGTSVAAPLVTRFLINHAR